VLLGGFVMRVLMRKLDSLNVCGVVIYILYILYFPFFVVLSFCARFIFHEGALLSCLVALFWSFDSF